MPSAKSNKLVILAIYFKVYSNLVLTDVWYSPIIYDRIYNHIMLKLIISITIFLLNNQKALPKNNFSFMVLLNNNNNNNIMKFLCWLNSTTFVMKNFKFNFFSIFL